MPEDKNIRILLVDDHEVVRTGLALIIEKHANLKIVGQAATRTEALRITEAEQPDIILLDLDLGEDNDLDTIPQLIETRPDSRIIVLTGLRDVDVLREAMQLGARGIVKKEDAASDVVEAILEVHGGAAWLERSMMGQLLSDMSAAKAQSDPDEERIRTLTDREREVVEVIGEGLKSKEVAARLFISETTVRHHLTSIFSKLEVADRVELMLFAYRNGLAQAPRAKR
jgi:two-component system nitrate/nitrite response regulator NarL